MTLSVVMVTKNAREVLGEALESIDGLRDELLVSDQNSIDGTQKILEQNKATIFATESANLGQRKQDLIGKAKKDWILVLDSDERISPLLRREISSLASNNVVGYRMPYQNYVFGKAVHWGGEQYSKVRLFRRGRGRISEVPLHEEVVVRGKIEDLTGVIHHDSYRSPVQLFGKFTSYAITASKLKKAEGEKLTFRKLFLYGPHMFWSRFYNEKGYKDGLHGFILAFAFGYMETLTYWFLLI